MESKWSRMLQWIPIAILVFSAGTVFAQESAPLISEIKQGDRNLVFSGSGQPSNNLSTLLEVEVLRPEGWTRVDPSRIFRDGERVRFAFTPTMDCFAYLVCKNSDGRLALLFPSYEAGLNCQVMARQRVTIPQSALPNAGWDIVPPAGREDLLLVISRTRMPDLDRIVQASQGRNDPSRTISSDEFESAEKVIREADTRDLFYVPDSPPAQVAPNPGTGSGYVGTTNPTQPLKVRIQLVH